MNLIRAYLRGAFSVSKQGNVLRLVFRRERDCNEAFRDFEQSEPANPGLDAIRVLVVGRSFTEATALMDQLGWSLRVAQADGQAQLVTRDWDVFRANVHTEGGVIVAVNGIG